MKTLTAPHFAVTITFRSGQSVDLGVIAWGHDAAQRTAIRSLGLTMRDVDSAASEAVGGEEQELHAAYFAA